jgi:tRNA uridine 5-carbamoylmethylation protein Kti12
MDLTKFKNLKSPYVLILVGHPLVGKSFFCNKFIKEIDSNVTIISRDQIVLDLYGNEDYNKAFRSVDQKEVDRLLILKLQESSDDGKNVIIDMTHMNSKRRRYNLSFFDEDYYKLAVIFPILSDEEYIMRDKKRTIEENKSIPIHVIKNMISSYQPIKHDEGFNRVISI